MALRKADSPNHMELSSFLLGENPFMVVYAYPDTHTTFKTPSLPEALSLKAS